MLPVDQNELLASKYQQGRALQAEGQLHPAKALYEEVLAVFPQHIDALEMLAVVNGQLGQLDTSVKLLCQVIELNPNRDSAFYYLGYSMCALKQFAAGVECFDKALVLNPGHAQSMCDRARALLELGQLEEALRGFDGAIGLRPRDAQAYSYRGNALLALGRRDDAIASFDQSIAIEPSAAAYLNRGNACQAIGAFQAAVDSYDRAIVLQEGYTMAHSNRSVSLKHLHRLDEAISSSDRATAIDPSYADAHWNRALTQLLKGDLAQGFAGYQWRWEMDNFKAIRRTFKQPQWLGTQALHGKKLLIHGEQGLGDTIQFSRYAAMAQAAGCHVLYEVEPPLFTLFQSLPGVGTLLRQGDPLPDFDYYCPVMSLPLAFRTDLATVPAASRYLAADKTKLAHWAALLGSKTSPRVGLVWSGNPTHQDDHNRSIGLSMFLHKLPAGFEYVSLQKDVRESDVAASQGASNLRHFGEQLLDFSDTAALCELMDLVITVDTSVAHLSGALGVPTWVLLPHLPDWRWLLNRRDSPWYPSVRLYRQSKAQHWDDVFVAVANDLFAIGGGDAQGLASL
jgi:tetratricopeptide (TPR) repeat protein